jgi:cyclic beta-1,2-glucan synthetase
MHYAPLTDAEAAPGNAPDSARADHWLRGPGRGALGAALGLDEGWTLFGLQFARRGAVPAYLAALMLGTLALSAWVLLWHGGGPWIVAVAVLTLFPASEAVLAVVNRLISESARPRRLARLALAQGIPPEHRVMVVIPAMLSGPAATARLAHRLLLHQQRHSRDLQSKYELHYYIEQLR